MKSPVILNQSVHHGCHCFVSLVVIVHVCTFHQETSYFLDTCYDCTNQDCSFWSVLFLKVFSRIPLLPIRSYYHPGPMGQMYNFVGKKGGICCSITCLSCFQSCLIPSNKSLYAPFISPQTHWCTSSLSSCGLISVPLQ